MFKNKVYIHLEIAGYTYLDRLYSQYAKELPLHLSSKETVCFKGLYTIRILHTLRDNFPILRLTQIDQAYGQGHPCMNSCIVTKMHIIALIVPSG